MFLLSSSNIINFYDEFSKIGVFEIGDSIKVDNFSRVFYNSILLFNPTTLYPNSFPNTLSLEKVLDSIDFEKYKTIIIPIHESSTFLDIKSYSHIITLIIDNEEKRNYILDSRSFTFPGLVKTDIIKEILGIYIAYPLKRIYINHQSIFDMYSCSYFTIMIIFYILRRGGDMRLFFSLLPEPNTLLETSDSFLSKYYIDEITKLIF